MGMYVVQHLPVVLIVPCRSSLPAITDGHNGLYRTRESICVFLFMILGCIQALQEIPSLLTGWISTGQI